MSKRVVVGLFAVVAAVSAVVYMRRAEPTEADIVTDVAVHTAPVTRATLHQYVTAYGYVEAAPMRAGVNAAGATVSPQAAGVLTAILISEGQSVRQGAVLFRLESRMADVAVQKAERDMAFAEQVAQRQRQLLPSDGTSARAVQEAEQRLNEARSALASAQTARAYLEVVAPLSGTVVGLSARVGQSVDAATVLARLVDLNRLVIAADVPVAEAAQLKAGQRVLIGMDSTARRGVVTVVSREVDARTGTNRLQASLPAGSGLAPGQFTDLRIVTHEQPQAMVVPVASVVTRPGEGQWIMVVDGDQASRLPVTVGIRDGDLIEVTGDGLREGMLVVTIEAYSLPEKTRVHIIRR
ncbi:MAG: efflux RND transporter periplasmic adaptor subunit [Gemmatimonadaceae bacterium]|nr:efflux RND transporter periplasmic adaptor subunit [Gemmatimonadaceae bacterium]